MTLIAFELSKLIISLVSSYFHAADLALDHPVRMNTVYKCLWEYIHVKSGSRNYNWTKT